MNEKRQRSSILVLALLAAAVCALALPAKADARHRRHGFSRPRVLAPVFHGARFSPYFYGWAPYHGFHSGYLGDRLDPAIARALEIGAIDLAIKPRKTEVFVDGRYVGTAGDFDGSPSYLWLAAGPHLVTFHKGGFITREEKVAIEPGVVGKLKLKLDEGESTPPSAPIGGPAAAP